MTALKSIESEIYKLEQKIKKLQESNKKWHTKYKKEYGKALRAKERLNEIEGNHDLVRKLEEDNTRLQAEINYLNRQLRKIGDIVGK